MVPYKVDVPVLLIFFTRVDIFSKVFEQVKIAKPSILFLYQDGPRENNPNDLENIRKCRQIAESIDWDCKVHKYYQPKNVGCDPSEFIAQKWAFSIVDRCVVLEDDDVPSQSFFPFCAELLEKYANDERINMICGMNHLGVSEGNPYDYLFSLTGAICGWASWKRVVDTWEENYDFLDNEYAVRLLKKPVCHLCDNNGYIDAARKHRLEGKAYYETIFGASTRLNSRLNIVPTKNMISNIGFGVDSVHTHSLEVLPNAIRNIFYMKTHELNFPLRHPKYVVCDMEHIMAVNRILGRGHYFVSLCRRLECRINGIKRSLAKLIGKK